MARLELQRLTKVYSGGVTAVDDVSLDIRDGEFMVLVGPSGCGKSTLLRMIAGLEDVTEGTIAIGGVDVTELAPRRRDIAMVFQSYALYPHMSVRKNIAYGLKVRRTPKDETRRRVEEVAALLGLEDLLDRKPAQLSGGQRQRVAMGRAIVREPKAFLMDEPLSNLDAKLRVGMRASLAQLHARLGVTTVYVTHDQTEAMTLGQRVAVIDQGVIQQVETPQNLYRNPTNTFVASFIGSPPMNFVEGRLDGGRVVIGDHVVDLPERAGASATGDRDVLVGLRPEDFADARLAPAGGASVVRAEIDLAEQLGPETYVYFQVPGFEVVEVGERPADLEGSLCARLDPRTSAAPGESLDLVLNPNGVRLFDPQTGLAFC